MVLSGRRLHCWGLPREGSPAEQSGILPQSAPETRQQGCRATLATLPRLAETPGPSAAPELWGAGGITNSWHLDIPMSNVD